MQSVTADYYDEEQRGRAFGTLHLTSAAGAALGGLYATNMGKHSALYIYLKHLMQGGRLKLQRSIGHHLLLAQLTAYDWHFSPP